MDSTTKKGIERKFLWHKPLPVRSPDRKVERFVFPKKNNVEYRLKKVFHKNGTISFEKQAKTDLPNGHRETVIKAITTEEFNSLLKHAPQAIGYIQRDEYDFENEPGITATTLVVYPKLHLARYEIEFASDDDALHYVPPAGMPELVDKLFRDETLSHMHVDEVQEEIHKLLRS